MVKGLKMIAPRAMTRWLDASEKICLPDDEVHVWSAGLDVWGAAFCNCWDVLSPEEMRVAMEHRFLRSRREFVVTRALVREILGRYTGRAPADVCLDYTSSGKPLLSETESLHFSVSHSRDQALLAVAHSLVGIDVEYVETNVRPETISEAYLACPERAYLQALPSSARMMALYRSWTKKEAVLKALGAGLLYPPKYLNVLPGRKSHIVSTLGRNWLVRQVAAPVGYVAAVAVEQPDDRLRWRQWSVHAEPKRAGSS